MIMKKIFTYLAVLLWLSQIINVSAEPTIEIGDPCMERPKYLCTWEFDDGDRFWWPGQPVTWEEVEEYLD
jgi:hypothetical protein